MADAVNNDLYDALGERWYHADDDPVALLRAESRLRNPWVARTIRAFAPEDGVSVLDIGCGAGFLANALAREGLRVTGIDASESSLAVAARFDETKSVRYERHDARALPFPDGSFGVACAMDVLEHVEEPRALIAEASRVLKPGGLFFFHTFNRTFAAWLFAAKGLELIVKNTPKNLHVSRLFIRPDELRAWCAEAGLDVRDVVGVQPVMRSRAFWRLLVTGVVPKDFSFRFSPSQRVGYSGWAVKRA
jgi:2-polyprenyl-6-hydroxyphenyl methylase/3-demethylubiquinone-9 3-methyltransferase